jgi:hypothetical protein
LSCARQSLPGNDIFAIDLAGDCDSGIKLGKDLERPDPCEANPKFLRLCEQN